MTVPQAGITNRPPKHLLLAALTFTDRTPTGSRATLELLRALTQKELQSDLDAVNTDKTQPSAETGELGFRDGYDRAFLTITLGISSSGFDALDLTPEQRPSDLIPIPWAQLGDAPLNQDSGDLILQICCDDLYVAEHVVRRAEEELAPAHLTVAWTRMGAQRYTSRPGRTGKHEGRALIGFLDGTSNLDPRNSVDDRKLVFVDPAQAATLPPVPQPNPGGGGQYGPVGPNFPGDLRPYPGHEPDWAKNGTYMTVRVSTFDTNAWDDLPQNLQEQGVGRFKVSGASLDLQDDPTQLNAPPAFAQDQTNTGVPLSAHVRKSNPRRSEEDAQRRIFRRGYPLIQAQDRGLSRGLAFVCFARSISTQFEFIFRAWLRNPDFPQPGAGDDTLLFHQLEEVVQCGGYYFVPPLEHPHMPWSWLIPDSP